MHAPELVLQKLLGQDEVRYQRTRVGEGIDDFGRLRCGREPGLRAGRENPAPGRRTQGQLGNLRQGLARFRICQRQALGRNLYVDEW